MGLWMTLASCESTLALGPEKPSYRYIIVENGNPDHDETSNNVSKYLEKSGIPHDWIFVSEPMSPPSARNHGVSLGKAPLIFFLDNHCIVEPGYFSNAMRTFNYFNADAVHSVSKFFIGSQARHEYRLTLERNFWGYQLGEARDRYPYKIAAAGHGGWAVRRSVWEELGGYWDGFKGYGGEEMYFELLMALTDKRNFLDPEMVHWHYAGKRDYEQETGIEFIKNMMMSAYLIGGETWLGKAVSGLKVQEQRGDKRFLPWDAMFESVKIFGHEQRQKIQGMSKRTLNEQLVQFSKAGLA